MAADVRQRRLLAAFAELLAYPRRELIAAARRCRELIAGDHPAAAPLARFLACVERGAPGELEELYTATFDLQPACAPYLGTHLCGETPKRAVFLSQLAGVYAASGFRPRGELADHISEVLAFLAECPEDVEREVLLRDGLLPALERMAAALRERGNPYHDLLAALLASLAPEGARGAAVSGPRREVRP